MRNHPFFLALTICGAILLSACNLSLAADVTPPPGANPPQIETVQTEPNLTAGSYPLVPLNATAGKELYTEKCAPCHGANGLGNGPRAADLPNPVTAIGLPEVARQVTPAEWYSIVTEGNLERFMPPFPSLTNRQRWDVVAYILSLSENAASLALGEDLYNLSCATCHGPGGKGDGAEAAGLQMPDFTDQEFMANRSADDFYQAITNGNVNGMPAFANQFSENQRWALAVYLRAFTYASPEEIAAATPQPNEAMAIESMTQLEDTKAITPTLASGAISGLVTNASGGVVPDGLEVMLHGFDDMQLVVTRTVPLADDQTYLFEGIDTPSGRMFFTTLQYDGITYGSEVSTVQENQAEINLPITVYDSTADTSDLKIDRLHLFFEQVDGGEMRVAELLVMTNTGNKTIIPPEPGQPTVRFRLPAGFQDLQFQDGELGGRYLATEHGFGDTASIYPGQGNYQILLGYTLPFDRKLELSQPISLPTDAVVILLPQENFKIKGENLQDAGTRDVQGVPYQMYNIAGLQAGENLNLELSTSAFPLAASTRSGLVIGLGALGLALVLGGGLMYWRNRQLDTAVDSAPASQPGKQAAPGANADTADELMDAILALDDLYHSGQIAEDVYIERRNQLKARLKLLVNK